MRVDPNIKKPQVICIAHNREMVKQTLSVYEKLTKNTGIKISDFTADNIDFKGCQIVLTTLGTLTNLFF